MVLLGCCLGARFIFFPRILEYLSGSCVTIFSDKCPVQVRNNAENKCENKQIKTKIKIEKKIRQRT